MRPGAASVARSVPARTWLALVSALLALATLGAVLMHGETMRGLDLAVRHDNAELADQLDRSHGELTGAMRVQGLLDQGLKDVLAGTRQPDAALYQGFATMIRQFALDNMQLVDTKGTTVAYVDKAGSHDDVGRSRSERAFVDRGLAGLTSRDPMVSRSSGVRGIYVAAPVRAERTESAPVAGIVVVRIGLGPVDELLRQHSDPAMLLSPDGLVYATNRADWALKLAEPLSDERLQALRRSNQFGKLLATSRPDSLPFTFSPSEARIDGRRYDLAQERLGWSDEGRGWRLLLLRERSFATEWGGALALAAAVMLAGAAAALVWLRRQARRMAAEQQEAAARAGLQARERQLQHVLESAPGAVIVTGSRAELLFHNRHALELHGPLVRDVPALYVDPADGAALRDAVRRDGHAHSDGVQMWRGDGSRFWAQVTLSQGQFADHRDAVFGWAVDVTERRQAAEAMRRAKEAAEAVAATKSAFLANMSHEIRTPMNAIIGLAHLALQTTLTVQQRDYIQKVYGAARALLGIVNDILDFSKIEAGKLVIDEADFDLDEVLGQLATLTGEKAADKGLELVFEVDPDVPRQLRGDALRLGQVLTNLVSNAVKFTAQGRIALHVALAPPEPGQGERDGDGDGSMALDITVSDTGIGMSTEQAARIFAPFSQADESTTRRFGGTGLGLSICKRLVEAAGGEITVDSAPGQGSRFHFLWPCTRAAVERLASAHAATSAVPQLDGLRVLLVEDNAINQQVATELMRAAGVAVDVAGNGRIALQRLQATPHAWDLVLMDLQMPEMDGHEATRLLRADPRLAALPIVAMTAHAMAEERQRCLDEGMNDHLAKPIDPPLLYRMLARWGGREAPVTEIAPAALDDGWAARLAVAVPGLQVASALARVRGDRALYTTLLQRYASEQASFAERFATLLAAGDRDGAARAAHTFKGVSATLGLDALAGQAARLEQAMAGGDPQAVRTALDALQEVLVPVLAALQAQPLPPVPAPAVAELQDPPGALRRLLGMLEAMDGDVHEQLAAMGPWLAWRLSAPEWAALQAHVRNYDYDEALAVLRVAPGLTVKAEPA